ncbi:Thioesterase superfamily protein [Perilla frutescens var. hirtella]|uniref:Acyl-coenzyme A thioesterase 13 n=1 Tax=Perilla frutescens var. hirtella TaxID=608512 RepID=A0AAD4JIT5_PERFH|nr:Thioesterase superfamily protein [Perilla frutescens var. frutescens]KAH6833820.1 Thioesterase superfamily protein [Perilla frutescens var. hirtella]
MDFEAVRRFVEKEGGAYEFTVDSMPERFIEPMVMQGMKIDTIERGRIVCSFTVPPRLVNTGNTLHGGATAALVDVIGSAVIFTMGAPTTGVSVEINVSYLNGATVGEEVEIESKALRVGKALAVVSVDLKSKKTGKLIAQGRHTKYLVLPSKI